MWDLKLCLLKDNQLETLFVARWNAFVQQKAAERQLPARDYELDLRGRDKLSRSGCKSIMAAFVDQHLETLLSDPYYQTIDKPSVIRKMGAQPREYYFNSYTDQKLPEKGTFLKKVCKDLGLSYNLSASTISNFYSAKKGGLFYNIDLYCAAVYNDPNMHFYQHLHRVSDQKDITLDALSPFLLETHQATSLEQYWTLIQGMQQRPVLPQDHKPRKLWWGIGFFVSALTLLLALIRLSKETQATASTHPYQTEEQRIKQVIRTAQRLEMEAYFSIPMASPCTDTINWCDSCTPPCLYQLRKYYMPYLDSLKAYLGPKPQAATRDVVGSSVLRGWTLKNNFNPSRANITSIVVETLKDSIAVAKTGEYYLLEWFDSRLGERVYRYEVNSEQRYQLKKNNQGHWIIIDNQYPNGINRKPPPIVRCCRIAHLLDTDQPLNTWTDQDAIQHAVGAIERSNLTLSLKCIECHQRRLKRPVPDKVQKLLLEQRLLYQSLNTDALKVQDFDREKIALIQKAQHYVEGLGQGEAPLLVE